MTPQEALQHAEAELAHATQQAIAWREKATMAQGAVNALRALVAAQPDPQETTP